MNKKLLLKIFVLVISIQVVSCLFQDEIPPKYVSSFVGKERNSFWVIKNMEKNRYKTDPAAWENIQVKKFDNDKVDNVNDKAVIYIDIGRAICRPYHVSCGLLDA